MPQSLARISLHLVFSTKDRRRVFLVREMRDAVAGYATGILTNLGCPVMRIGVVTEHVHILYLQSRTETVADVVAMVRSQGDALGYDVARRWRAGECTPKACPTATNFCQSPDPAKRGAN